MAREKTYDLSVFINCPFDGAYKALFEAIVFAVHDCGYIARSALEIYNSGQVRIEKIARLIEQCGLGVHDLSRTEPSPETGLPRFNMPLELGMFLGAQWLGSPRQKRKSSLVLDIEPYRYQRFCSDIAGQDIAAHDNDPKIAVRRVRDWLRAHRPDVSIPSGSVIWRRYGQYRKDAPIYFDALSLDPNELTFNDFTTVVASWIEANAW